MKVVYEPESLALGVGLIVLGVLWILSNLGRIDLLATVRAWWPAVLVLWGGLELVRSLALRKERRR
jgi:hypothetical protein